MFDSCNPVGCSPPGSFVHSILQAKILEWVAISFSREFFQSRNHLSNGLEFSDEKILDTFCQIYPY